MNNRSLLLYLLAIFFLSLSCEKEGDEMLPALELSTSQLEVIRYFKEVALGFESGSSTRVTRKWDSQMKVFVSGKPSDANRMTLEQAIRDINQLATDGFSIEIVKDSISSNCYIFFGSGLDFLEIFPDEENSVNASTIGHFRIWWNNDKINKARIIINPTIINLDQQRSVILEEITQSTGLTNDSPSRPNSIFYETLTNGGYATEYADIDKELIRLLYHPEMSVGLNPTRVDRVLRNILATE